MSDERRTKRQARKREKEIGKDALSFYSFWWSRLLREPWSCKGRQPVRCRLRPQHSSPVRIPLAAALRESWSWGLGAATCKHSDVMASSSVRSRSRRFVLCVHTDVSLAHCLCRSRTVNQVLHPAAAPRVRAKPAKPSVPASPLDRFIRGLQLSDV